MENLIQSSRVVILPNVSACYSVAVPRKQLLMIGGGRPPHVEWLQNAAKDREIWCIDHGLDVCLAADLKPNKLIGDGDSASSESWLEAQRLGVPTEKYNPIKDFTDTQLALQLVMEQNAFIVLSGGLGNRFDHTYSTVFSFANAGLFGCMADEQEQIFFLRDGESITIHSKVKPKAVSLLPISFSVEGVSTEGLRWELSDGVLTQSSPYAVSNEMLSEAFTVRAKKGILAVYICQYE